MASVELVLAANQVPLCSLVRLGIGKTPLAAALQKYIIELGEFIDGNLLKEGEIGACPQKRDSYGWLTAIHGMENYSTSWCSYIGTCSTMTQIRAPSIAVFIDEINCVDYAVLTRIDESYSKL